MEISTLSIIAGTEACNARCPYCISRMTPDGGVGLRPGEVNWRNFETSCRYAKDSRVSTALLTGKGEPTLFPNHITAFLERLAPFAFPFVELQTNGITLAPASSPYDEHLAAWREAGLTTIAVSIVHHHPEKNREIFAPHVKEYFDLKDLVARLHGFGFSVRLTATMIAGWVDGVERVRELARFAKDARAEQLTIRPVNKPAASRSPEVAEWVDRHRLGDERVREIANFLEREAALLMELPHGALVYDLDGQNVSLADSLTIAPRSGVIRQLIFFPDGHLRYDWQHPGAVLL